MGAGALGEAFLEAKGLPSAGAGNGAAGRSAGCGEGSSESTGPSVPGLYSDTVKQGVCWEGAGQCGGGPRGHRQDLEVPEIVRVRCGSHSQV